MIGNDKIYAITEGANSLWNSGQRQQAITRLEKLVADADTPAFVATMDQGYSPVSVIHHVHLTLARRYRDTNDLTKARASLDQAASLLPQVQALDVWPEDSAGYHKPRELTTCDRNGPVGSRVNYLNQAIEYVEKGPDFAKQCCPKCSNLDVRSASEIAGQGTVTTRPTSLWSWLFVPFTTTSTTPLAQRAQKFARSEQDASRTFYCPQCDKFFVRDENGIGRVGPFQIPDLL